MDKVVNCQACLLRAHCCAPVPGRSPVSARIMLVGEAPGEQENQMGRPFIGKAGSTPIQFGAQGIIKMAMGELTRLETRLRHGAKPLFQIHDSLLFEALDGNVVDFAAELAAVMENVVRLSVPVRVEVKVGKQWGEMACM